jgi:hypothetical protein
MQLENSYRADSFCKEFDKKYAGGTDMMGQFNLPSELFNNNDYNNKDNEENSDFKF